MNQSGIVSLETQIRQKHYFVRKQINKCSFGNKLKYTIKLHNGYNHFLAVIRLLYFSWLIKAEFQMW